jgi:ABC-2 type transport system permease protein
MVQTGLLLAALAFFEGAYWLLHAFDINLRMVLPWTGYLTWPNMLLLLPVLCLSAISCGLLGVAVGVTAKTIDSFAVMMNFVIFPLFFLSGALYPIAPMPALARWAASINPFTYCVDLLRHVFTSHAEFAVAHSMAYLLASALLMLAFSLWRFSKNGAALPLSQ